MTTENILGDEVPLTEVFVAKGEQDREPGSDYLGV